jgi:hypothetical protein
MTSGKMTVPGERALYLNPPPGTVLISVDEKSGVQATPASTLSQCPLLNLADPCLIFCARGLGADQGSDGRMAAQPVQAAAAGGPDAADRDAQLGADLGVRHRRVCGEQGDQLLAARRQVG